jgi:hypothetical protein
MSDSIIKRRQLLTFGGAGFTLAAVSPWLGMARASELFEEHGDSPAVG